ncbi:MAG: hypothetical protein WEE89_23185 [Gemmatimonadota bacterium]
MKPNRYAPLLLVLFACSPEPEPVPAFEPVADVKQLMSTILEPAAEVYWDAVGWIIDAKGTTELKPANAEEWAAVRNAAFVMAETGNLLMMKGRAPDNDAWMAMSKQMIEVSKRAIAAADARDPDAVFTVGGDVYEACTACHARYAVGTLRPSHSGQ